MVAQQSVAGGGTESQADATEIDKTLEICEQAIKKHGPKTVLDALERSRTSTSITDT